jgi:hypothetical protein
MALPNDAFRRNDDAAVATDLPTHKPAGSTKEFPVSMEADSDGHIRGSAPAYLLIQQPRTTTAAATDFFDIFNASGSGKVIRIRTLRLIKQVTAASAIVPYFEFHAIKTSAAGTAGTAYTYKGSAAPSAGGLNIAPLDNDDLDLNTITQITARSLPTGGATAAQFLFPMFFSNEETYVWAEGAQYQDLIPQLAGEQPIELNEGEGFKIRQITATASTGTNYGWMMAFTVL